MEVTVFAAASLTGSRSLGKSLHRLFIFPDIFQGRLAGFFVYGGGIVLLVGHIFNILT